MYEIVLAQILVSAGSTEVTARSITDTRPDSTVCGWVTGTVDSVAVDQLTAQAQAQFAEWFEHMKGQLSEDAAGNLQLQIDALDTHIDGIDTAIGDTDISAIGDGTLTGAVDSINKGLIVQFPSTGWTTTETVNGTTYYTQTVSVSSVSSKPIVGITPLSGTLPTGAEQSAFDSVSYFTANDTTNTIKAYATSAPANTFAVVVKGAR
jgi:hypothetical protein